MGHSLLLSFLTMFMAFIIGLPLGILIGKTTLPLRRFFMVLFTVPFLVPPYVMAVSWKNILGRGGLLAKMGAGPLAQSVSRLFFGLSGCVWVLGSVFVPVVMMLTLTFLKTVNPRLEEAGRIASGWRGVLSHITLPLIMPGLLLSAILVFLLTLGSYGVPAYLRYNVFAVETFTQFSAFYNVGAATAAAMPLVAVALILIMVERYTLREKTYQLRPIPAGKLPLVIDLGARGRWMAIGVGGIGLILVILPLAGLAIEASSLEVYREAMVRAGGSLWRSLGYAVAGATGLTILGLFLGILVHTRAFRFWRAVDSLTVFLFTLSGAVMGVGLIGLWNHPSTNLIYGTPAIVILGYLARYAAVPHRITLSALAGVPAALDEAARVAGAGWFRRLGSLTVPLIRRSLLAGWLAGYVFCLRDTEMTLLVYPPGRDPLSVRIFTLMANGSPDLISALCVLMIAVTRLPFGIGGMAGIFRGKR